MLRWLFIDMNSYFASAEQQDRPALRGRPVGVIPLDSEHTSIIAASIEAKRAGIRTGTRVRDARQLCPGIALVKARPAFYVALHKRLLLACEQHAPCFKVYSIDEWAVRLAPLEQPPDAARALAMRIKQQIAQDVGPCLTCSVGIAPTRLLAKIACDLHKPDGLTVLDTLDLPHKLAHLQLQDLAGIGSGMHQRLRRHHVNSVEDLWNLTKPQARAIWGSVTADHWWMGFHGIDTPEPAHQRRSMGHSNVLDPRLRTREGAHGILTRLLHKLAARLRQHAYVAHALHAQISFDDGSAWADAIALPGIDDTTTLLQHFERLWQHPACRALTTHAKPRKVGVIVSQLEPRATATGHLFTQSDKPKRIAQALDQITQRFGSHKLYFGGMHGYRHSMDDKIAFGRIPDETSAL